MAAYRPESTVMVRPFARRHEGSEVIIGTSDGQAYLAIPADGLEILDSLAAGNTVGETVRRYQDRHGETPDVESFLEVLAAEGFLDRPGDGATGAGDGGVQRPAGQGRRQRTVSLDWISPTVATRLASGPAVVAYLAVIAAGFALFLTEPSVVPSTAVFLFPNGSFAAFMTLTFLAATSATFVHELAHAVVARAAGVPVTLQISHLMYTMVAQTDVSGLLLAPKRKRYLAFMAGAIVDLVFASLLLFLLHADRRGVVDLPPDVAVLTSAILLTYLIRVLFQFNFYLRTDVYYLVATAFDCRDLLTDTETMLKNVVFRLTGRRHRVVDQSGLSARERTAVRLYSVVYVTGRAFAIWLLFVLFLPLVGGFAFQLLLFLTGRAAHLGALDFLAAALLVLVVNGGGILLWVRSLYRGHLRRRAAVASTAAQPTAEAAARS